MSFLTTNGWDIFISITSFKLNWDLHFRRKSSSFEIVIFFHKITFQAFHLMNRKWIVCLRACCTSRDSCVVWNVAPFHKNTCHFVYLKAYTCLSVWVFTAISNIIQYTLKIAFVNLYKYFNFTNSKYCYKIPI